MLKMKICHETKLMDKLAHPNIVQFKGILLKEDRVMLEYKVFDLKLYHVNAKVHNLSDLVKNLKLLNCYGYENLVVGTAQSTIDGLIFIHLRGVVHIDLKLRNALVGKKKFNNASSLVVM